MQIHFVCKGNVYRSRLAETYLKSKRLPGITVTSSGTHAKEGYSILGPISWQAMRIIKNNKLVPYMKAMSEQTTKQSLRSADLIIFLNLSNYEYAKEHMSYTKTNFQIWNILDIDDFPDAKMIIADDMKNIAVTEATFEQIKEKIHDLIEGLQ